MRNGQCKAIQEEKMRDEKLNNEELEILHEILAQLKEANKHLDKIESQTFGYSPSPFSFFGLLIDAPLQKCS